MDGAHGFCCVRCAAWWSALEAVSNIVVGLFHGARAVHRNEARLFAAPHPGGRVCPQAGREVDGCPIRFVHGTEDRQAELSRLEFVEEEGFALRRVPAGHLLLGQAKATIEEELKRLRRAIQHASGR